MIRAICVCLPIASMVTIAPVSSRRRSSSRMITISLNLSDTAFCPSTNGLPLPRPRPYIASSSTAADETDRTAHLLPQRTSPTNSLSPPSGLPCRATSRRPHESPPTRRPRQGPLPSGALPCSATDSHSRAAFPLGGARVFAALRPGWGGRLGAAGRDACLLNDEADHAASRHVRLLGSLRSGAPRRRLRQHSPLSSTYLPLS